VCSAKLDATDIEIFDQRHGSIPCYTKKPHAFSGIRTRNLLLSRPTLYPQDYQGGLDDFFPRDLPPLEKTPVPRDRPETITAYCTHYLHYSNAIKAPSEKILLTGRKIFLTSLVSPIRQPTLHSLNINMTHLLCLLTGF